jgi:ATP-dependent DNA helicase RecG
VRAYGEVRSGFFGYEMVHPQCKPARDNMPVNERLTPIYPTTAGLSQIADAQSHTASYYRTCVARNITSPCLPSRLNLPSFTASIQNLHQPSPDTSS